MSKMAKIALIGLLLAAVASPASAGRYRTHHYRHHHYGWYHGGYAPAVSDYYHRSRDLVGTR